LKLVLFRKQKHLESQAENKDECCFSDIPVKIALQTEVGAQVKPVNIIDYSVIANRSHETLEERMFEKFTLLKRKLNHFALIERKLPQCPEPI
jgi:hypothetical protein